MSYVKIKKPIWDRRKVGIAEFRLQGGSCFIDIDYRDQYGNLLYPQHFFITKEKAFRYPVQTIKGTVLRIIPIEELEVR